MAGKKSTGKKGGRSRPKALAQESPVQTEIMEKIAPTQPATLPVEVGPMSIQPVSRPNQTVALVTDQPAPQRAAVGTTIVEKTTPN